MIYIWDIAIPQLTGEETRRAYVYLPDSFKEDPTLRYPVLYMFDGHNVFFDSHATYGKSWGMKKYMDETQTQVIIVAVECNHSPDFGRLSEYSPYSFHDPFIGRPVKGRGRIYMNWLVQELKPWIDENFPTLPDRDHTMIAGSSMGGLMSFYAVLKYNSVFSRVACLSPSLWVAVKKLSRLAQKVDLAGETVIYMDYGSNELANHMNMLQKYTRILTDVLGRGIYLESRIVPGGDHCEACWEQQIPFFMNTLLYQMPDIPHPAYDKQGDYADRSEEQKAKADADFSGSKKETEGPVIGQLEMAPFVVSMIE